MATVRIAPRAALQLRDIYEYSAAQWGYEKAGEYLALFEKRFGDLGENALLGRARPEVGSGYRSVVVGKHVVFYRGTEKNVVVVAVLHGTMDIAGRLGAKQTKPAGKKKRGMIQRRKP